MGVPLYVVQDENKAETFRQAGNGPLEIQPVEHSSKDRVVCGEPFVGARCLAIITAESLASRVDDDGRQPGPECGLPAKPREAVDRADPAVVHRVLCASRVAAREPEGKAVQRRRMPVVQAVERVVVAVAEQAGDKVPIFEAVQRSGLRPWVAGSTALGTTIMILDIGLPGLTMIPAARSWFDPVPVASAVR